MVRLVSPRRSARATASTARRSSCMETRPREPGSEEYLDSEKYQLRSWDRDAPVEPARTSSRRVNRIRRENPPLQTRPQPVVPRRRQRHRSSPTARRRDGHADSVLVVVNVDPHHAQSGWVRLDLRTLGLPRGRTLPGARPALRRALSLARRAQLRVARSRAFAGAHLPGPPPRAHRAGLRLLPVERRTLPAGRSDDPLWYKDAVIYELHVRAFFDSNDDGIGDFRGLTSKLDYIQDLGVNYDLAAALLPLAAARTTATTSPTITTSIRSTARARTSGSFVDEAHRRGLRVITELVINHTSDQHPWFQAARRAPPGSPKRNYYVWSDSPTTVRRHAHHLSPTPRHPTGRWDPVRRRTTGTASSVTSPISTSTIRTSCAPSSRIMRFWLDHGVDGLRLDAIPYLVEREGTSNENLPRDARGHQAHPRGHRRALRGPHAARRSQPLAGGRARLFRGRRRMPHGVPLPADAAHVHGHRAGRPPPDRRDHATRRPIFPTTASGPSSCAITTSSRSRW